MKNIVSVETGLVRRSWQAVKGELIGRFGSIRAVAARVNCHPNSLRAAVEGACPGVRVRLDELLASVETGEADGESVNSRRAA